MGDVRSITPPTVMAIGPAVSAYLATLSGPEQRGTRTVYRSTLRALAAELSPAYPVGDLDTKVSVERLTGWFTDRWANRAPATWNRNLDAVRAAARYWIDQGWITTDPTRRLRRRGRAPDRTRAIARGASSGVQVLLVAGRLGDEQATTRRGHDKPLVLQQVECLLDRVPRQREFLLKL